MEINPAHINLCSMVADIAAQQQKQVYIVGGVLRDLLQGRDFSDRDLDFCVEGRAIDFARVLAEKSGGIVKEFSKFHTAKVLAPKLLPGVDEFDVAEARTEIYSRPGALPDVRPGNLDEDLKRRDFSINAMAARLGDVLSALKDPDTAASIRGRVIDKFDGLTDLDSRLIRILHPASFTDDPTRIFRACRYLARIGGAFDLETERLAHAAINSHALDTISDFRIASEMKKIFAELAASKCVEELFKLDVPRNAEIVAYEDWERLLGDASALDLLGSKALPFKSQALCASLIEGPRSNPRFRAALGASKKDLASLADSWRAGRGEASALDLSPLELVIRAGFHNNNGLREEARRRLADARF